MSITQSLIAEFQETLLRKERTGGMERQVGLTTATVMSLESYIPEIGFIIDIPYTKKIRSGCYKTLRFGTHELRAAFPTNLTPLTT